jgi:hypothetical protein
LEVLLSISIRTKISSAYAHINKNIKIDTIIPPISEKKNEDIAELKLNPEEPYRTDIFPASSAHINDIIRVPIKPTTR